jgi:hypothetical protein
MLDNGERIGIWFNKRALTNIELTLRHRLSSDGGGWRIDILARGDVIIHLRDSGPKKIQMEEGDVILGNGDDLYVGIAGKKEHRDAR